LWIFNDNHSNANRMIKLYYTIFIIHFIISSCMQNYLLMWLVYFLRY